MRIYISIPMSGKCETKQRQKALQISELLKTELNETVNPWTLGDQLKRYYKENVGREPTYWEHMKADLEALQTCGSIFMCEGWENSQGCNMEHDMAKDLDMGVLYETVEV